MKFEGKFLLLFLFAALFLAQAVSVSAAEPSLAPVNITLSSEKDAVFPGECSKYVATVVNSGPQQRVDFMVEGIKLSWVALGDAYLDYTADPAKNVVFYICPAAGTPSGTYNFVFSAKARYSNYTAIMPFAIFVMDRPFLEIRDVTASKDIYKLGESIDFSVNVRNLGLSDAKNVQVIAEMSGENAPSKMRLQIPLVEASRGSSALGKFDVDRFKARGNYVITASIVDDIGDVLYKATKAVAIEEKSELKQETAAVNNALSKQVILKAENTGNKRDTAVLKSSGMSYLALYSFDRQPDSVEYIGTVKAFTWKCDLGPGDNCSVSYRVEYWLLVITALAALGILYVVYTIVEQPEIKKRVVKTHDREHTVHITIKNRSNKPLHEVHVVDTVPEIVSIVPNTFSPSIKPNIKGKKGGSELVWTFAKLEPKEERIITYRIRPLVMLMGRIRLPKARIYAVDKLGKKYRAESAVMVD